jgi:zinc ribbon protein
MASTPKKPWVAFLLSILLTGAGLAYLGKWGWAVLNLLAALGIGIAVALTYPDASSPVGIGILVGSAVLAKNLAVKMNQESAAQPQYTGIQAPPPPVITVDSKPVEPILVRPVTVACSKCGANSEAANFCAECGAPLTPVN